MGSERSTGPIGTAKIVHVVPGDVDISLGLVRGGIARDCGVPWRDLPRQLEGRLLPGTDVILRRPRQRVLEGRQLVIESSGFRLMRLVPAGGATGDLFGGTSGAVVFLGEMPIGMVLEAENTSAALALRMDEIVAQLTRFLGSRQTGQGESRNVVQPAETEGDPIEALSWTAHPIEGASDPAAMLAGQGPWIFELGEAPVKLTVRLTETDRLSRIQLFAAEDVEASIPRQISVAVQASSDPNRPRSSDLPAPEMTPDGVFDLRVGERFAKLVTITIRSSWGDGSPVRLDRIVID
ncbi:MAG: hypothetical protein AAFQ66_11605 [Pseudomonadota bacterium]